MPQRNMQIVLAADNKVCLSVTQWSELPKLVLCPWNTHAINNMNMGACCLDLALSPCLSFLVEPEVNSGITSLVQHSIYLWITDVKSIWMNYCFTHCAIFYFLCIVATRFLFIVRRGFYECTAVVLQLADDQCTELGCNFTWCPLLKKSLIWSQRHMWFRVG